VEQVCGACEHLDLAAGVGPHPVDPVGYAHTAGTDRVHYAGEDVGAAASPPRCWRYASSSASPHYKAPRSASCHLSNRWLTPRLREGRRAARRAGAAGHRRSPLRGRARSSASAG
jgi:hypothetical protein